MIAAPPAENNEEESGTTTGLIGFRTEFMTATSGEGLLYHTFEKYAPVKPGTVGGRINGVLISNSTGVARQ